MTQPCPALKFQSFSHSFAHSNLNFHFHFLGWTLSAASSYCSDYIGSSSAAKSCRYYVETNVYIDSCRSDLLFSGNSRVASLHLKNLKEDCRQVIETDKSLSLSPGEKEEILDALCLSACSGHGSCHQGKIMQAISFHISNIRVLIIQG